MKLNEYMNRTFPKLELKQPLFYNWDIGIRFELGVNYNPNDIYPNCTYLNDVYNRTISLFKVLHSPKDDIYIVVDVNDFGNGATFKKKLNIFSKYIKKKSMLYKLQHITIPYIYPEDDEEGNYKTQRFIVKCKTYDINYIQMLKAICNQDMGINPRIFYNVYYININNNTIFHVYDDRGCDLIATSPKSIENVYQDYSRWILDYDRTKIEKTLNIN
jgi:Domain of unknown function (DUF3885)